MNNNELVNLLRSGKQKPIKITFNNQDSFEKLAGRISNQLEADSITLLKVLTDEDFYSKHNFNKKTVRFRVFCPPNYRLKKAQYVKISLGFLYLC